jgi:hypothetical protein
VTAGTPDLFFQVANGFMAAKHLFVAADADGISHFDDIEVP